MTHYQLSQKHPHSEFLQVEITFTELAKNTSPLFVRLPAWRPGRYQLGNFAKNIRNFKVECGSGKVVNHRKKSRNLWEIDRPRDSGLKVSYEYYTSEIDGGSTFVNEEQWYLNFINCLMYIEEDLNTSCEVKLDIPSDWIIACGLKHKQQTIYAQSFYELVDSPVITSKNLTHIKYELNKISFHLWFKGDFQFLHQEKILSDFQKFTEEQLKMMGDFESDSYHFLFQISDQKAYHGVEHLNSTCIVLGPAKDFNNEDFYDNLLGISSHELFHYWNIIRIRPKEMWPYDFTGENYFSTGYVAEGVTTYYGDLFLIRSGVKNLKWYQNELNKLLKRHFDNNGRHNYSVADSSMDLWVDGYEMGTPSRKVSIYVKGAIIALILDLKIILESRGEKSFDNILRDLWNHYYKNNKGYSAEDYLKTAESVIGYDLAQYKKDFIEGKAPLEGVLSELFPQFGYELIQRYSENPLTKFYGLKYTEGEEGYILKNLAPNSPAEDVFRREDVIISINRKDIKNFEIKSLRDMDSISFHVMRNGKMKTLEMTKKKEAYYYAFYEVKEIESLSDGQINLRKKWLNA